MRLARVEADGRAYELHRIDGKLQIVVTEYFGKYKTVAEALARFRGWLRSKALTV